MTAIALAGGTGGCETLWTRAAQTRAVDPQILGVVDPAAEGDPRQLIVAYRAWDNGKDVRVTVPIGADGQPLPPFRAGAAAGRGWDDVDGRYFPRDVPPAQRRQVVARLATATRQDVRRAAAEARWEPADDGSMPWRTTTVPTRFNGVVLLGYTCDAAGRVTAVDVTPRAAGDGLTIPKGTRLVLVPASVPRPAGDRATDVVVAVLVTPVAVPFEAVSLVALAPEVLPVLLDYLRAPSPEPVPPSVDADGQRMGPPPPPPAPAGR